MTLTKPDLDKINLLIIQGVAQIANKIEETNEKIDDLGQKIRLLPTKDEFFGQMSKVMGELKAIREEHAAQSHQLSNHEDRIETLEKLHPEINPASV